MSAITISMYLTAKGKVQQYMKISVHTSWLPYNIAN